MSIQAISWVLENSRSEGIARLVLLSLANHAHSETGECFPGQRAIARDANCSPGTVSGAVRTLVELGEVRVVASGRGRSTTKYHLPWLSTDARSARSLPRATDSVARGESPVARGETSVARGESPVARAPGRANPLTINQNRATNAPDAPDAAPTGGAGRPNPTRSAREILDGLDRDKASQAERDVAFSAIAAARAKLRHDPPSDPADPDADLPAE